MDQNDFRKKLDKSKNYGDLFDLVKRAVKKVLGLSRSGLMLYLEDLPLQVGAFHTVGSNGIVLNRRLLEIMSKSTRSITDLNSFIFTTLLHEYLHSFGYLDEGHVRKLVYKISLEAFGSGHPAVQMALDPPFPRMPLPEIFARSLEPAELVKDFEGSRQTYIV